VNNFIIANENKDVNTSLLDYTETSRHVPSHSTLTMICQNCGFSYVAELRCGDRTCAMCRVKDYYRLLSAYRPFLASKQRLRLITLTLKGRAGFLPQTRIKRLRQSFTKLLHQSYYKRRLSGGFYSIEAKRKVSGWNIHIHVLAEGLYIDQRRLKRDWYKITGDSYIVDIRVAYSAFGGFKYILKYLSKAPETLGNNQEYNSAFKGVRLVSGFGTWYKKNLLLKKEAKICPTCGCDKWFTEFDLLKYSIKAGNSPPFQDSDANVV